MKKKKKKRRKEKNKGQRWNLHWAEKTRLSLYAKVALARNQITAAQCGSPRGSNPCVMSPLAPIGSLKLLLPGSVESKNSEWSASNSRDERFAQSPSMFSVPPTLTDTWLESHPVRRALDCSFKWCKQRYINIVVRPGVDDEVKTKQRARSRSGDQSDLSAPTLERGAVTQVNKVCFVFLSQVLYFVARQRHIWHSSQTHVAATYAFN